MVYIGVDPSYTKTGVCCVDTTNKKIVFKSLSPKGTNKDYKEAVVRSEFVADSINEIINKYGRPKVIIEEPLNSSFKASRLGILSGVIVRSLTVNENVVEVLSIPPSYVYSINRPIIKEESLNKKKASVALAKEIIKYFKGNGYSIETDGGTKKNRKRAVISHDEAEAFIIACSIIEEKDIKESLNKINIGFSSEPKILKIRGELNE